MGKPEICGKNRRFYPKQKEGGQRPPPPPPPILKLFRNLAAQNANTLIVVTMHLQCVHFILFSTYIISSLNHRVYVKGRYLNNCQTIVEISLKNIFCSFCKSIINRKGPSYKSDRFISVIYFYLFSLF